MSDEKKIGEANALVESYEDLPKTVQMSLDSIARMEREMAAERQQEALAALLADDATLTVNVLRSWTRERIERFALHLLGDKYQEAFTALSEWREAEKEADAADERLHSEGLDYAVYNMQQLRFADEKVNEKLSALRSAADSLAARPTAGGVE